MHSLKHAGALALLLTAVLAPSLARADEGSPVGLWTNVDDVTGRSRALIRITEANGTLQGKIEKVFPASNEEQNPRCGKCEGALRNAPIVGMVILSGLKRDGDEYSGGQILDPENGKFYSSKLRVTDNGKKLSVRGYIGVAMLGRTQTWIRN